MKGNLSAYMGQIVTQKEKDKFAATLKAWRARKKLSQAEAAEYLGVPSKRTLQNWEIARTKPVGLAYNLLMKILAR